MGTGTHVGHPLRKHGSVRQRAGASLSQLKALSSTPIWSADPPIPLSFAGSDRACEMRNNPIAIHLVGETIDAKRATSGSACSGSASGRSIQRGTQPPGFSRSMICLLGQTIVLYYLLVYCGW